MPTSGIQIEADRIPYALPLGSPQNTDHSHPANTIVHLNGKLALPICLACEKPNITIQVGSEKTKVIQGIAIMNCYIPEKDAITILQIHSNAHHSTNPIVEGENKADEATLLNAALIYKIPEDSPVSTEIK